MLLTLITDLSTIKCLWKESQFQCRSLLPSHTYIHAFTIVQ
uniref:Uncharacterized protein n=1 Tax=Picea glauca TaxID=3330 RepID=A0A101LZS8_PICGL|nr:hypothetical protein ABT39_MTgene5389 [Picea glauca]